MIIQNWPGVWANWSQMEGPLPSLSAMPSTWYADDAVPNTNPVGKSARLSPFRPAGLIRAGECLNKVLPLVENKITAVTTRQKMKKISNGIARLIISSLSFSFRWAWEREKDADGLRIWEVLRLLYISRCMDRLCQHLSDLLWKNSFKLEKGKHNGGL